MGFRTVSEGRFKSRSDDGVTQRLSGGSSDGDSSDSNRWSARGGRVQDPIKGNVYDARQERLWPVAPFLASYTLLSLVGYAW